MCELSFKSAKLPTRAKIGNSEIRKLFIAPTSPERVCRPDMALDVISYKRCNVSGLRPQKSEISPDRGEDKSGLGKPGMVNTGTYLLLSQ